MKKAEAIKYFAGVPNLARVLGIRRAAIAQWPDEVPEGRAFQLHVLTDGGLKAIPDSQQRYKRVRAR
jgi:hypothetical protein